MDTEIYTIAQLAEAANLSRRAVRFYVQEKLLPPPDGAGRGSHYTRTHLDLLRRIAELQRAGHALDAIRRMLNGKPNETPPAPPRPARSTAFNTTLVSRLELIEGVELSFDAARFSPDPQGLFALRELARQVFRQ